MDPNGRGQSYLYRKALQPLSLSWTFHLASLDPSHRLTEREENLEIMRSDSSSVTQMGKAEAQSKDMPRAKLREMTAGDVWGS